MCPWPRFQSAMLDDQSFTVTYQGWRGEPRSRGKRHEGAPSAGAPSVGAPLAGDCVDCGACVTACPTGIDIRDGIQLECINCGLCIDACNHVMERTHQGQMADHLGHPGAPGRQEGRAATSRSGIIRPRTIIYLAVLLAGMVGMTTALLARSTVGLSVQRDRAPGLRAAGRRQPPQRLYHQDRQQDASSTPTFDLTVGRPARAPGWLLPRPIRSPVAVLRLQSASDEVDTFRVLVTAGRPSVDGWVATDRFCAARHRHGKTDCLSLDFHGSARDTRQRGQNEHNRYGAGFPIGLIATMGVVFLVNVLHGL